MLNLSSRAQLVLGLGLALLMAASRGHHFASLDNLPSASWALFFIAGFYLRSRWAFAGLMAEAVALDLSVVGLSGAADLCITASYPMLLPAYGALWLGGQWLAKRYRAQWSMLVPLILSVLLASTLCQLISSGSYYYFSGRFADPTLAEFAQRMLRYGPLSLQSMAFYIGLTTLLHGAWLSAAKLRHSHQTEIL
ncbi:cobalamin ABC transporter [Marinobacterium aestuarii]|uniref:Cobalamin ABC transporter n=1 Tax=Marinobacterium aestuarii TaxID=1821621 RepID=A0A1A9F005_9GAMM|nr:cobalamin ABC transporter [Marinobacterium aestuarii]ANG63422.1 cobalamin ABC transporter [Marinobacterium aestuarii]